jgi:hypothetical protein
MSPGLAALAVAVVAGGIIAVSSREARVAVLGLILAGVTAPLIGDPLPDPLALASRVIAMVLGGYLLWVASAASTRQPGRHSAGPSKP